MVGLIFIVGEHLDQIFVEFVMCILSRHFQFTGRQFVEIDNIDSFLILEETATSTLIDSSQTTRCHALVINCAFFVCAETSPAARRRFKCISLRLSMNMSLI